MSDPKPEEVAPATEDLGAPTPPSPGRPPPIKLPPAPKTGDAAPTSTEPSREIELGR
ncbi:hypothetical protein [Methylobacterium planeticum]|uniref:hypothetical protein n=1 Tax=Methylobacterium planeticum TaxID=2615211 RepID=UPI00177CEC43|nr:hypothetical protein [Methylobacterium planeticum]